MTIAYLWCGSYSTSINTYGMWMTRAGVQVSKSEFYTQIHLDYAKVEILFCIKKKKDSWIMGIIVIKQ